jgi:hypothetical protein
LFYPIIEDKLVVFIALLEYDILKELAALAAITILGDHNNKLLNGKISKTKPTTAPYLPSI